MKVDHEASLFWIGLFSLICSIVVLPFGSLPMVLFGLIAMGCGFYLGAVSMYRIIVNVKEKFKHESS
jgi:hypothetical protein